MGSKNRPNPTARRKARRYAMQALYQWQVAGADLRQIEQEFLADNDMSKVDVEYFRGILYGVPKMVSDLDEQLAPIIGREIEGITTVEQAILRLGAYELNHRIDVPYRVVINESVELAKLFGATDGHRFVNGVLDQLAQKVRVVEIKRPVTK